MSRSLTLDGWSRPRALSLLAGLVMMVFAGLTIRHYFAANYPTSIFEGSFCDISAFLNCDSSAYSALSAVLGVPIGWFGLMVGGLVVLGALLPSPALERTNRVLSTVNVAGVIVLAVYSVAVLGSLCLLCAGFYLGSLVSFGLFLRYSPAAPGSGRLARWGRPSWGHLAVFALATLMGAWGMRLYHDARRAGQAGGVASRVVAQFYSLPRVPWPSEISAYRTASATEAFEEAPIQVVEYGDLLCSDCRLLYRQLKTLEREFEGRLNLAFQFFPLEAACNDVVDKDKHPGACEVSYIAAHDPRKFRAIHDEVLENMEAAGDPAWRADLARRHGVEEASTDPATRERVHRLIRTGAEYAKTHERYRHGIRSTPTLIINNRMVIGTLPIEQLRAIFRALLDEHERGEARFMESWIEDG